MKIATWNVNSIKVRKDHLADWLREAEPDVVCLQEIKCVDDAFPAKAFEDLNYNVLVHGQKTYNGVAILSKYPIEDSLIGLPGDKKDDQARYAEIVVAGENTPVRIGGLYLPNGNPAPGPKYDYKLAWMDRLYDRARDLLETEEPFLLIGDYNIIPHEDDVHDADAWKDDALFRRESRAKFYRFANLGLTDAYRALNDEAHQYTFWDYQGGAYQKDNGIRIDHLMLSPQAADLLTASGIDAYVRAWEKPSDHVPVWCELEA